MKLALALALSTASAAAQEVNLYTLRAPERIEPLLERFTDETGIAVNTLFLGNEMIDRVVSEGDRSPADLILTLDVGMLAELADRGLTQPVRSAALDEAVPAELRSPDGQWFALSRRLRVLYFAKHLDIRSFDYEDLADPEWKGRICSKSGRHPYSIALISGYIAHNGAAAAEEWLMRFRDNLARPAGGEDSDVAHDIARGVCDIGIANSYNVGKMLAGAGGAEHLEWVNAIRLAFPTFRAGGTQMNISGAAVARNAPNRDHAVALLEFLASATAQRFYVDNNFEHPVQSDFPANPLIEQFGRPVPEVIPLHEVARHRGAALDMVLQLDFDQPRPR